MSGKLLNNRPTFSKKFYRERVNVDKECTSREKLPEKRLARLCYKRFNYLRVKINPVIKLVNLVSFCERFKRGFRFREPLDESSKA